MENELTQQKMKALRELADTNVLIAQGKALLIKLEKEKETFFVEKETELTKRINTILTDSQKIFEEAKSNYAQVHEYHETLESFSSFLDQSAKSMSLSIADFRDKIEEWKAHMKQEENLLQELRKDIQMDTESIKREKQYLKRRKDEIESEQKHVESQQQALQTSYKEIQKLWNKSKKN